MLRGRVMSRKHTPASARGARARSPSVRKTVRATAALTHLVAQTEALRKDLMFGASSSIVDEDVNLLMLQNLLLAAAALEQAVAYLRISSFHVPSRRAPKGGR